MTLTELLLVIVLIGVLVVVLWTVMGSMGSNYGPSIQSKCGKNLSQIVGACVAYSTSEEAPWPSPWPSGQDLSAIHIADAHEARLTTIHMLSILAVVERLPNSIFKCPGCSRAGPATKPALDRAGALLWGAGPARAVSYAWDWTSPAEPGAVRVIGADRSPANHKGKAMAVFGDSHSRFLRSSPGIATGMVTEDSDGSPMTAIIVNPDALGKGGEVDNIYSPAGDGGDPLCPGKGAELGSWVK